MEINLNNALGLWKERYGEATVVHDFAGRLIHKGSYGQERSQHGWNIHNVTSIGKPATLSDTLKLISTKHQIHPAMFEEFLALSGYTSDAKGIRHSGNFDGPNATFEEAKYMLVTCAAFINFEQTLISK